VPNIYALNYLEAVGQDDGKVRTDAIKYINEGIQRQLRYRHDDDSFSAFESDDSGSTWLTAFVVRSFRQAKTYVYVDEEILENSLSWLYSQYDARSMTFAEPGRVIHTDMQGGTGTGIGLTAFVLLAFLENKEIMDNNGWGREIDRALDHLASTLDEGETDPLALNLITYALHVARRTDMAENAYEKMMSMKTEKDGMVYWEKAKDEDEDEPEIKPFWCGFTDSTASSIEMTSYALLTMALRVTRGQEEVTMGLPVTKYLASERNENGGFHSTQDTVTGLFSLSEYSRLVNSDEQNIDVSVQAGSLSHTFDNINPQTATILQKLEISLENSADIRVSCRGRGSALVQLNVRYNVQEGIPLPGVDVSVDSQLNSDTGIVTTDICASWSKKAPSGMAVVEMTKLSAHEIIEPNEILKKYKKKGLRRVETELKKLVLYLDELTEDNLCLSIPSQPTVEVMNMQEANVVAYSYYNPQVVSVTKYLPKGLEGNGGDNGPGGGNGNRLVVSMVTVVMAAAMALLL